MILNGVINNMCANDIRNENDDINLNIKFRGYTYEQCMDIGDMYVKNMWEEIFKKYPKLNKQKVYSICSYFHITKKDYFWSCEDEQLLKENYGKINSKEIEKMMNNRHSCKAINAKAQKMGLGNDPFWTKDEEDILINNYSFVPKEVMCSLLPNRTADAIMNHAKLLNIKSYHYLNEKYTEEQKQFIIDNWKNMTDQEIADKIGKNARGVMEQRNNMRLFRVNKEYGKYENLAKMFRGHIQEWKNKSMNACGYKCIFTGSSDFAIHHIYSFNKILEEAFMLISKEIEIISDNPADYSKNDLDMMIEIFKNVHDKYPLGICVRKDIHDLFHKIYGSGGNNEYQWGEFVKDYKNGKYNI